MQKLLLASTLLFLASPSLAAEWHVDPLTSKLLFRGEQAGEKFQGSFPAFKSQIDFDEAAPTKGSIHITIDMSKLQVDGKDRLDALPTDDWFAVKQFPHVSDEMMKNFAGFIDSMKRAREPAWKTFVRKIFG